MITVDKKYDILHSYFVDGKGYKTIERDVGNVSKNTIKRYVKEYGEQFEKVLAGGDKAQLFTSMSTHPKYDTSNRTATVANEEVVSFIKACLAENDRKKAVGKGKLIMRGTDIYEALLDNKFSISYQSVTKYIRQLKENKKEAFIKQIYHAGEVCEFDWGDAKLEIDGKEHRLKMAVFTLAYSNIRYSYLYRHEDTQSFMTAHISFFADIGGVLGRDRQWCTIT